MAGPSQETAESCARLKDDTERDARRVDGEPEGVGHARGLIREEPRSGSPDFDNGTA